MQPSSGQFGRTLEPGLRKIFFETYKEKPSKMGKVMNVLNSQKAVETDYRMGGFTLWNEKGTQDATEYEEMLSGDPIFYRHKTFSKGMQVEKELMDDQQYNVMNKRAKALARTARATVETHGASLYNNAFATNGYDGVPLISASHPRLDGGTAITNLIAPTALSESAVETAVKMGHDMVDERGIQVEFKPKILLVPGALEITARKILESIQSTTPGGASVFAKNDKNIIADSNIELVVWDYLSSATAWFMIDPDLLDVNFFWRERLSFKGENDFDTDIAKYKGRMRYSYGWSDFRGVIGSAGA